MRAVVQRVKECSVRVNNERIGFVENGLLVYLGVAEDDTEDDIQYLVKKIINLRIYEDEQGKMNLSILEQPGYNILVVSQFTLLGDTRKGRRPSYSKAAPPEKGNTMYRQFISALNGYGFDTQHGEFGAYMEVAYTNAGPITILLDSTKLF